MFIQLKCNYTDDKCPKSLGIRGTGTLTRPCVLTLCTIPENSSSVMKNGISGYYILQKNGISQKNESLNTVSSLIIEKNKKLKTSVTVSARL